VAFAAPETGPNPPANAAESPSPGANTSQGSSKTLQEVEVTGTRIVQNGYTSPTPVTVQSASELAEKSPGDIPDALNQLPQFSNSTSPSQSGYTVATSPLAGDFLNLRNLGPNRTLILLDGVRVPATSADGAVDVDTLPEALVQRVDIVTGGASAVYGSDAVAGVVNYVLNDNLNGLVVNGQVGSSGMGDDRSFKYSVAGGTALDDGRLHLLGSLGVHNSDGLPDMNDRPLAGKGYCLTGNGTPAAPFTTQSNCWSNFITPGGLIATGPLAGYEFLPGGTVTPFFPGTGPGNVGAGPYPYRSPEDADPLVANLRTEQAFGRATYDITPDIDVFVQGSYGHSVEGPLGSGLNNFTAGTANEIPIYPDNAFLNPAVSAQLGTVPAGSPAFLMTRWAYPDYAHALGLVDLPSEVTKQTSQSYNAMIGTDGKFGGSWGWNAYYVHGQSNFIDDSTEVENTKFYAALNAVVGPNGQPVCDVTLTNPGLYPGCVPLDVFGVGAPSQAAVNYVTGLSRWEVVNTTNIVDGSVHGNLFNWWGGTVAAVLGAEYRTQSLNQTSNSNPAIPVDETGLGLPATMLPIQKFNIVNVGVARGTESVREAYTELAIPLAHDLPLVKRLELTTAGRYTDYSTSGAVETWKLGLAYVPVSQFHLRGTVSRDIRAPSLYELDAGLQEADLIFADPHTGVTSVGKTETSGNGALTPERGLTKTVGFVYEPDWLKGFGLSVDYYDIKITDAIVTPSVTTAIAACDASNGTSSYCNLIVRPFPFSNTTPANFPSAFISEPINAASLIQRGVDFEANYNVSLDRWFHRLPGAIEVRGLATYVPTYDTTVGPDQPVEKSAGYSLNPIWRGSMSVAYVTDRARVGIQERFTGSFLMPPYQGSVVYANYGRAPGLTYTDLNVSYDWLSDNSLETYITVNNLFNIQPPLLVGSNPDVVDLTYPTMKEAYDVIGTYVTLGFRWSL
jgi:iron complex outermembrane recepter protein